MSKTARISDEAHEEVLERAEERDVPVSEVMDEIITERLAEADIEFPWLGYCPGCGFEFRKRHQSYPWLGSGPGTVTCPVPSCPETGQSVNQLKDEPPAHVSTPIYHEDLAEYRTDEQQTTDTAGHKTQAFLAGVAPIAAGVSAIIIPGGDVAMAVSGAVLRGLIVGAWALVGVIAATGTARRRREHPGHP
jgi:hypothetical protein